MLEGYLVDIPDREREGVRRLVSLPQLSQSLFFPLGLNPIFSWYLLEIRHDRLCEFIGDVDILAGRLTWRDSKALESLIAEEVKAYPDWDPSIHASEASQKLAYQGCIAWPPPLDYLVAIEAKCAKFVSSAESISGKVIKSDKSSPGQLDEIRRQVSFLEEMGFDRTALLDIISTESCTAPPKFGQVVSCF